MQRGRGAPVVDDHLARDVRLDPAAILLDVRGVDAQEELALAEARHDHVVDAAALVVQHQPIARAAEREVRHIAGHERIDGGHRTRAREMDLAHVRDVEEARALADRGVLLEDRGVLDRHLVAREGNEACAQTAMGLVERGAEELAQARAPGGWLGDGSCTDGFRRDGFRRE